MSKAKDKSYSTRPQHEKCQLCCAHLEKAEKDFYPCPCNFQVCIRCFEDINSRRAACPGCKQSYRSANSRKRAHRRQVNKPKKTQHPSQQSKEETMLTAKKEKKELRLRDLFKGVDLADLRVIQKDLVYLIGLSPELANEKILSRREYLGQYGKIKKLVINKNQVYNANGLNGPCYSAYITFSHEHEAAIALLALDEFYIHDRVIRASYGTTKYCLSFIRKQECKSPTCYFLHSVMKKADTIHKDDMQGNKSFFQSQQKIAIEQIRSHAEEIIQKAKDHKIKSIFPNAATLQDKIAQYLSPEEKQESQEGDSMREDDKEDESKDCEGTSLAAIEDLETNKNKGTLETENNEPFGNAKETRESDLRQEFNEDKETPPGASDCEETELSTTDSLAPVNQGTNEIIETEGQSQDTTSVKSETKSSWPSSNKAKTGSPKRTDSRYDFARQSSEIEEFSEIEKSIQDYIHEFSISNFSKNLLDHFPPENVERNSVSFFDKRDSKNYLINSDTANSLLPDPYFLNSLSFNDPNSEKSHLSYRNNNGNLFHKNIEHVPEGRARGSAIWHIKNNTSLHNPFFNFNESY